jgi:helicase
MLKTVLASAKHCIYIVPLRALASEKYDDFRIKYSRLGIKIGIATGDYDVPNRILSKYQILIATSEKIDSLLRFRSRWLTENLGVVILDEIHFLDDSSRGPTIEILTARMRQLNPKIQFLALSATIQNAFDVSGWLNAELVTSSWSPVPLKEGVFYQGKIRFADATEKSITYCTTEDITNLSLDTVKKGGQALIFVNSRRSTQATAKKISKKVIDNLLSQERVNLKKVAQGIENALGESTKICRLLAECVCCGVAFHHAGLMHQQRRLIEDNFRKGLIKIICSTPTLAAGVNLPARRVILRDYKRYEAGAGSIPIRIFEYKQCAGRAGRPKYDTFGEAILVAKTESESTHLLNHYIYAQPEPISSKLGSEPALRTHILASVSSGYVYDVKGVLDFLSHTFLAYQRRTETLIELIARIFDFLEAENMIIKRGFKFHPTAFGRCISRLYIDPLTGVKLRDGLYYLRKNSQKIQPIGLIHLISCCPDMETPKVNQKDYEGLNLFIDKHEDELIEVLTTDIRDYQRYLSIIKSVSLFLEWVSEEKEEIICDRFSIGPGDIRRYIELADWLMYSAIEMARLFKFEKVILALEEMRLRIRYGIREELMELVNLKGIGRVRSRSLYKKGYRKIKDLDKASLGELIKVPYIGDAIASAIKRQLSLRKI